MMPKGEHDNHTGPKRTPRERESQMTEMMKMIVRGYRKCDIAEKFGLDRSTITRDWKIATSCIKREQDGDLEEWRALTIATFKEMEREAWEAWELSKEDSLSEIEEITDPSRCKACAGTGSRTLKTGAVECSKCGGEGCLPGERKLTKTKAGRLPAAQYLQVIERCKAAIRAIKGLDADVALKLQVEGEVKHKGELRVNVNWDELHQAAKGQALKKVDDVEALIEQAGQLPSGLKEIAPSTNGNGQHGGEEGLGQQGQDEVQDD